MSTEALLLIDIQNDYFLGGRYPLMGMEHAAANAAQLLAAFREKGKKVFHVRHANPKGSTFFCEGSAGVEVCAPLRETDREDVIVKRFPNAFRETSLLEALKKCDIDKLVTCGAMSHMCIDATTRAAADQGFVCSVIHDACATTSVEFHGVIVPAQYVHVCAMASLAAGYARILSTAELNSEL